MFNENYQWTITNYTKDNYTAFYIDAVGYVSFATVTYYEPNMLRPSVYLKSSVNLLSGDGSISNPYILSDN